MADLPVNRAGSVATPAARVRAATRTPVVWATVGLLAAGGLVTVTAGTIAQFVGTTATAPNSIAAGPVTTPTTLRWWGSGGAGQGGIHPVTGRWTFGQETTGATWAAVSAGGDHTCALRTDDSLWCWGRNDQGQLGLDDTTDRSTPTRVGTDTWSRVTTGEAHTCAGKKAPDTNLYCWGRGTEGQIGDGNTAQEQTPTVVAGMSGATHLAAGYQHTCAIVTGSLSCWGRNNAGQLGKGTQTNTSSPGTAVLADVQAVAAGRLHTCAVRSTAGNPLYCWGYQQLGQTGRGFGLPLTSAGSATVTTSPINQNTSWAEAATGIGHTCARKTTGTLWCTGINVRGQLGQGDQVPRGAFTQVGAGTGWTGLAGNGDLACGLQTGTLWCWGVNGHGQAGLGQADDLFAPAQAPRTDWAKTAVGWHHVCGVTTGGALYCAGRDQHGQLGRGATQPNGTHTPTTVGTASWASVSSGRSSTCGVQPDGSLWCWGSNGWGQLGTGETTPRSTPTQVDSRTDWASVAVGNRHTCAVRTGGTLWCWGGNADGQLGRGNTTDSLTQVQVTGVWKSVAASSRYTCAIASDDKLWCWGANEVGQLGVGDTTGRTSPTASVSTAAYRLVATGADHACGIQPSNLIQCWGSNQHGQVRPSGTNPTTQPSAIGAGQASDDWTTVAIGDLYTCGIRNSTAQCWGNRVRGASGPDGGGDVFGNHGTIFGMSGVTDATAIAAGGAHTCVLRATGTVACIGANDVGQLGQPGTADVNALTAMTDTSAYSGLAAGGAATFGLRTSSAYLTAVLADSPIGYWRLGDAAGTVASPTAGGVIGTYSNGPVLAQTGALLGDSNTAASFDGVNDRVTLADPGNLYDFPGNAPFTIEFWLKRSAPGASALPRLVTNEWWVSGTDNGGWSVVLQSGADVPPRNVRFTRFRDAAQTYVGTAVTVPEGRWSHIAATYDGATMRMYLDGELQGSVASALGLENDATTPVIGSHQSSDYFGGGLDEVAIYNSALSGGRIQAHYRAARP